MVPPMVASVVSAPATRYASGTASSSSRASPVVACAVPVSVRASRSIVTSPVASVVPWRMVNGATVTTWVFASTSAVIAEAPSPGRARSSARACTVAPGAPTVPDSSTSASSAPAMSRTDAGTRTP